MFFVLSVGDFGTLVKISCKYLIQSFFWNHESYRNFWCWRKSYVYMWLVMYKFSVVLAWRCFPGFDDAFCMMHKTHVHNILHHQTILCEYASMFVMLFIWWHHVVILWNYQSHSKCVRSCNLSIIFWNVFWYLCGFWLYVSLTCFVFEFILWFLFVASVFISISLWFWCWTKHLDMINVMINDTTFYHFHEFFFMKFWWFCFCEKILSLLFPSFKFVWFLLRIVIKTLCNYMNSKEKHQITKNFM